MDLNDGSKSPQSLKPKDILEDGRHRVLQWVKTLEGEENLELDDLTVVHHHGVPLKMLDKYVKDEMQNDKAFKSLPIALFLVFVYSCSFLMHCGTTVIHDMEQAIITDLHENSVFAYTNPGYMGHKDLHDVHSIADLYSWLRIGLRPLIFRSSKWFSEPLPGETIDWPFVPVPDSERPFYLQYNRIVGGVQLLQQRAEKADCLNPDFADAFGIQCDSHLSNSDFNLNLQPEEIDITAGHSTNWNKELSRWFLVSLPPQDVEDRLRQLEMTDWINNSTIQLAVNFMTYNAHFGTLTLTEIHFFFSRSGHMWKKIVNGSFFMDSYHSPGVILFDMWFVLTIVYLLVSEMKEMYDCGRAHKWKRNWFKQYLNFWNAIDWMVISFAIVLIVLFGMFLGDASILKSQLLDLVEIEHEMTEMFDRDSKYPFSLERKYQSTVEEIGGHFVSTVHLSKLHLHLGSLYPIALVLRMFKAFDAQPRLALVTRTLSHAAVDIAHFGIVFAAIFLTYAVTSTALFGQDMAEFSTFGRSCHSCFRALMGDSDADAMNEVGRPMAFIWYWSFHILIVLILLNMLLAIIMDTYSEVKDGISSTTTLLAQLLTEIRRWRQNRRGERVTLAHVDSELRKKFGHVNINVNWEDIRWAEEQCIMIPSLIEMVQGLEMEQAVRLMEGAIKSYRRSHQKPLTLYEAVVAINDLKKDLGRIAERVGVAQVTTPPSLAVVTTPPSLAVVTSEMPNPNMCVSNDGISLAALDSRLITLESKFDCLEQEVTKGMGHISDQLANLPSQIQLLLAKESERVASVSEQRPEDIKGTLGMLCPAQQCGRNYGNVS